MVISGYGTVVDADAGYVAQGFLLETAASLYVFLVHYVVTLVLLNLFWLQNRASIFYVLHYLVLNRFFLDHFRVNSTKNSITLNRKTIKGLI